MLRVQPIPYNVTIDPLSLIGGIRILNGNPVQSYNRDTGEFNDDRTLVPLLILPWASVTDPNGIMKPGEVIITGVEYYTGSPTEGKRISSGGEYIISDVGTPTYSLKVKKNTPVDQPIEIYALYTFTDTRTNMSVKVEKSISLYTTYYEASNYSVKLNQPTGFTIDPTRTAEVNGKMPVELIAQMYSGKEIVPDTNTVYFWYLLENDNYRLVTDDDIFIMKKVGKTITLDAFLFEDITIKVRAAHYVTGSPVPTEPTIDSIQATTTIKVALPPTATAKILENKGSFIAPGVDQAIQSECIIEDNVGRIPNPEKYYFVLWYARAQTTGAVAKQIGHGFVLNTTSKQIGINNTLGYDIYAEPYEKGSYKPATDNNGNILTDDNGNILLIQTIKD